MKNKLWIYGCSYSNDAYFPRYNKGWFDYIADEFDLECINRSDAGFGWNRHQEFFYEDMPYWNENDKVIVESSHLVRMYSPFLQTRFERFSYLPHTDCITEKNDNKYLENLLYITKPMEDISDQNWNQFITSISILNKFFKNWYWWVFEFYPNPFEMPKFINYLFGNHFLKFDNDILTFDDWMRKNPSYCFDRKIGDLHQTYECHKKQGELFINQIKEYEK